MKRLPENPEENENNEEDSNIVAFKAKVIDATTGEQVAEFDSETMSSSAEKTLLGLVNKSKEEAQEQYDKMIEQISSKEEIIELTLDMMGWQKHKVEDEVTLYTHPDPSSKEDKIFVLRKLFTGVWALGFGFSIDEDGDLQSGQEQIINTDDLGYFVARLHDHGETNN